MSAHGFSASESHSRARPNWGVKVIGIICLLLGLVLLAGGVWLIVLGGTWYYALAGLGLAISGAMLIANNIMGVWVYALTWLGTMIWAWFEVGDDWWAQVPRMVAPTLLFIIVLLCLPALYRARSTPRPTL